MSKVDTFPEDEEIIVGLTRGSFFAYYHLSPAKLKLRERTQVLFSMIVRSIEGIQVERAFSRFASMGVTPHLGLS